MYCVNENKDAKAHFAFFFNFSYCHSYITHIDVFLSEFSQQLLDLGLRNFVYFQIGKLSHIDVFCQSFLSNYLI